MNDSKDARSYSEVAEVFPINLGHVYVVEFSDGWVKVGMGRRPKGRISAHQSISKMRGAIMTRSCVSALLVDCKGAERELIEMCAKSGVSEHGNEWFSGVDFEELAGAVACRFEAATDETLALDRKTKNEQGDRIVSAVRSSFEKTGPIDELQFPTDWSAALVHAQSLEQMYLDECYGGEIFADITGRGHSLFFLNAALAFSQLGPMGIAELYASALEDSEECISTIERMAAKAAALVGEAA